MYVKKIAKPLVMLAAVMATSYAMGQVGMNQGQMGMNQVHQGQMGMNQNNQGQIQPPGSQVVVGPPVSSVASSAEEKLEYRDPTKPLTVGEMAKIQKEKATHDFLKKAGFTTVKPKPPADLLAKNKKPEKIESRISVKAVFTSDRGDAFAEIDSMGKVSKFKKGDRISKRLSVYDVGGNKVTLNVAPERILRCKKGVDCNAPTKVVLRAGQNYQWFD